MLSVLRLSCAEPDEGRSQGGSIFFSLVIADQQVNATCVRAYAKNTSVR